MGVDLMLLPVEALVLQKPTRFWSASIVDLERRRALWDAIMELPCDFLAAPLCTPIGRQPNFDEPNEDNEDDWFWDLRQITDEDFDSPLCSVTVENLQSLRDHEGVRDNTKNRAAWAYLAELPPDTRIALFWY